MREKDYISTSGRNHHKRDEIMRPHDYFHGTLVCGRRTSTGTLLEEMRSEASHGRCA